MALFEPQSDDDTPQQKSALLADREEDETPSNIRMPKWIVNAALSFRDWVDEKALAKSKEEIKKDMAEVGDILNGGRRALGRADSGEISEDNPAVTYYRGNLSDKSAQLSLEKSRLKNAMSEMAPSKIEEIEHCRSDLSLLPAATPPFIAVVQGNIAESQCLLKIADEILPPDGTPKAGKSTPASETPER